MVPASKTLTRFKLIPGAALGILVLPLAFLGGCSSPPPPPAPVYVAPSPPPPAPVMVPPARG